MTSSNWVTSPRTILTLPSPANADVALATSMSTHVISWPAACRIGIRRRPMNPAPPITKMDMFSISLFLVAPSPVAVVSCVTLAASDFRGSGPLGRPLALPWRQKPRARRRPMIHRAEDGCVHRVHAHQGSQLQQALLAIPSPHRAERLVAD